MDISLSEIFNKLLKSNKLIFSPWFEQLGLIINYFDVGARGDVSEPWTLFSPGALKVIGFEPDPAECERLELAHPDRKYFPNALWSTHAKRPFYLCEWASTSSMYPPAEATNRQYRSVHWTGRTPATTVQVECVPLDAIVTADDAPDFIKIDTQGAELEILRGAERLLREGAPLVLAETWCTEVYEGMPLTHEVMSFMHSLGYEVFDLNVAAAWQHRNAALPDLNCKARTIGFDLLFVKRLEEIEFHSEGKILKFAALCELFGFRDYAMAALEKLQPAFPVVSKAFSEMTRNDKLDRANVGVWKNLIRRFLGRPSHRWPSLH